MNQSVPTIVHVLKAHIGQGKPLVYGQSITDGCIGWDMSVDVLEDLAKAVRDRSKPAVAA